MVKKFFSVIFVYIALFAFLGLFQVMAQEEPPIAPAPLTPEELLAIHEDLNHAMNAHDAEMSGSFFAEDAVWYYTPLPTPITGREEIKAFFSSVFQAFPDFHVEQRRILVSGNTLVTECTVTATHLGDWMGIPPTGKSTQTIHLDFSDFGGDKVKQLITYDDGASLMMQFGLMPTPASPDPALLVPSFPLPDPEPTGLSPLEANAEAYARLSSHDLESYAKMIRVDADIFPAPFGMPTSREQYIAMQENGYLKMSSDFKGEITRAVDMGDGWVVSDAIFSGINDSASELMGFPATGKAFSVRGGALHRFDEDGLITNLYVYADNITLLTQLGLLQPTGPTPEDLLAVLAISDEAVNTHNAELFTTIVTDDFVYDYVAQPPPFEGKEAIAGFFNNLFQTFPDVKVELIRPPLISGNIGVVEHVLTGTHSGPMDMGPLGVIPPTGKSIQTIHTDIAEFEGGKVKKATTYDDIAIQLVQLGLMPALPLPELKPSSELPAPEPNGLSPLNAALEVDKRFNAHDLAGYAKMFKSDAKILLAVLGTTTIDRDALLAFNELYFLGFPDIHEEIVRMVEMPDGWVLYEVVFTGTHTESFLGIPATGRSATIRGAILQKFDSEGLVTDMSAYFDNVTMMAQLGLLQPPPPDLEANKTLVRDELYGEIWSKGNLDKVDEIFAPVFTFHSPGIGDFNSPEAFKQLIIAYRKAFPDMTSIVEDQVAEGDWVTSRFTLVGTHKGDFKGIPATNKEMSCTVIASVRVVGGKIVDVWSYTDMLGVMQQMGIIAPERPTPESYTWGDPSTVTGDPGTPEANKAIGMRFVDEFWNQKQVSGLDETHSADFIAHNPMIPGSPLPLDAYKQVCLAYITAFPDFHVAIDDTIIEGDKIAYRWTVTATHKKELMGIPATDRKVSWTGMTIYRFADGKIVENWWAYDALGLMQKLTAPPAEPVKVGSISFDSWLKIIQMSEFKPEQKADGLYLAMTTPSIIEGDYTMAYDDTGEEAKFKASVTTDFQELKVGFDDAGTPVSASGPGQGSVKLVDSIGNEAFVGKFTMIQTMSLGPDMKPTGVTTEGYAIYGGVGVNNGLHFWATINGKMAPNPADPKQIGYALYGKGTITKHVIASEPPTGHHVSETTFRYKQDYGLAPEQRPDGLYLVGTRPAIALCEYRYLFDNGEEITGNLVASGTGQELKVIFDENGVPLRAVGSSYGVTMRGSDSYGNIRKDVMQMRTTVHLSPDMKSTGVTADAVCIGQLEGIYGNYIATDRLVVTSIADPDDPTKVAYKGIGEGEMTKVTGLSSVGMYSMNLTPGLNIVSLPLDPVDDYNARSLAEELGATMVISYENGQGVGFTPDSPDDGFSIEAGKGYIVNLLKPMTAEFIGTIWNNTSLHNVSAAPSLNSSAWAFVVSGLVLDGEDMSAKDGGYIVVARNLRTGSAATRVADSSGYFATIWADLNRKAVIESGDKVEVSVIDSRGKVASGPFVHEINLGDIQNAVKNVQLRLGDIIPEKPALLQNYPNPFNPETWIPYQLNTANPVAIRIYSASGQLVKTLDMGFKEAGMYVSHSKAAYWDGKNEVGEEVASGIYFYSVTTGDFSATRKMVIKK